MTKEEYDKIIAPVAPFEEIEKRKMKPCDFCSKDVRYCDCVGTCDFIPKYNLCPVCKELTEVHEPICHKCGYVFKSESEEK